MVRLDEVMMTITGEAGMRTDAEAMRTDAVEEAVITTARGKYPHTMLSVISVPHHAISNHCHPGYQGWLANRRLTGYPCTILSPPPINVIVA